jgi:hypothetical protein
MFVGHACQPVGGALLRGAVVCDASVVDDSYIAFLLSDLPGSRGYLGIAGGATWALIISFLSAIPCKVTRLSAKEAGEDFPLPVPLNGSSLVSPFSTSSDSLFVSVSSWEEIFRFCYPSSRPSWGGIHCIWIPCGVSPLVTEWPPGCNGW